MDFALLDIWWAIKIIKEETLEQKVLKYAFICVLNI